MHKERTSVTPTLIKSRPLSIPLPQSLFFENRVVSHRSHSSLISLSIHIQRENLFIYSQNKKESSLQTRQQWVLLYFSLLFLYLYNEQRSNAPSSSPKRMALDQNAHKSLFDSLYCEEEKWVEIDDDDDEEELSDVTTDSNDVINGACPRPSLFPLLLLEQDLFWDDEELQSLFLKEKEISDLIINPMNGIRPAGVSLPPARKLAVEWILKVKAHYGFSALTAILAVNYLDRFLSSHSFQKDKPWMMQLAAVTCLSLASKIEETHVPLLLDFQVEDAEYVFEAKTIQRMEILVLSALKWRMNPVTPLSFLDHIIRRLGLKSYIHWEFLTSCENLLLSVLSDSRFVRYMPSVLATSTMLHIMHQVEPSNAIDYENQLLGVLKINKEEVDDCYEVISDILSTNTDSYGKPIIINPLKRRFCQIPNSPSRVMDAFFSSESSNDSWGSTVSQSWSLYKRRRVQEQQMKLSCRAFVDSVVGSPH